MCDPPRIYPSLPEYTPLFNQFRPICATLPESTPPSQNIPPPFSTNVYMCPSQNLPLLPRIYPPFHQLYATLSESTPPRGVLGWLLVVVLFAPIWGGSLGICFVCWMLLRHCTEALVYSNHPRAAAASSYLAIIFGRIASGVPWLLRSTAEPMQHPHQC